jgi:hypothetical protein
LSLHDEIVKRLITEELNLRLVNFNRVPHTLTASQKLERAKISRNLSGQFNKLQLTISPGVITGDEIWVYVENPRSAMWVGAGLRRSTQLKQLIGAKSLVLSVFHPI